VRESLLPYGRQSLDDTDIQSVVEVLKSDWLTTGPKVGEFEERFAAWVGARYAVSFSSGTAALHAAAFAAGLQSGDEAITTPMTFCSTVHVIEHVGARPILVDVEPGTLNLDPRRVREALAGAFAPEGERYRAYHAAVPALQRRLWGLKVVEG
jgi:dTDP-4-amino-4,6-dideoxygalactose transaminase